jgi:hypothetical protein
MSNIQWELPLRPGCCFPLPWACQGVVGRAWCKQQRHRQPLCNKLGGAAAHFGCTCRCQHIVSQGVADLLGAALQLHQRPELGKVQLLLFSIGACSKQPGCYQAVTSGAHGASVRILCQCAGQPVGAFLLVREMQIIHCMGVHGERQSSTHELQCLAAPCTGLLHEAAKPSGTLHRIA